MCQKRKQILWSGRVLIAWPSIEPLAGRERVALMMSWWRSKNNFTSNFLTYQTCSSWHRGISETGKLDTDFVVSCQQHNFRCPYRCRPCLFARYAWRNRYSHRTYKLRSAFQTKYPRKLCTALRAYAQSILVSSGKSSRAPCLALLNNAIVKTKKSQNRWMSVARP